MKHLKLISFLLTSMAYTTVSGSTLPVSKNNTMDVGEMNTLTTTASLGIANYTGNTEEYSIDSKLDINYQKNQWENTGSASIFYSDDDDASSHDASTELFGQTRFFYTNKKYRYLSTDFIADTDDGYQYIWNTIGGVGKIIYQSDDNQAKLSAQLGPGYRLMPVEEDEDDTSTHVITLNGSSELSWNISEYATINEKFGVSYANISTIIQSDASLDMKIKDGFGISFNINITFDSYAPDDSKHLDTSTTLDFSYTS